MAYAAVTCLYYRIHYLLNSPQTCVASSTKKILRCAGRSAKRLQRTLKVYDQIKNNSPDVMSVDARIRDEACKLEDAIESEASAQFLPQSDRSHGSGRLHLNLHHLKHEVDSFVETSKKMRKEYTEELYKQEEVVVAAAAAAASAVSSMSGDEECDMVGIDGLFRNLREFLTGKYASAHFYSIEITGMAGMGKTALAKKLFRDPSVRESFDCRAFVVVGQKYEFEEILGAIIAQLDVDEMFTRGEDEGESQFFKRILTGRKFLIVLDDVWDVSFDRDFTPLLPENCDGSFVLVTSRIEKTFKDFRYAKYLFRMSFLNEDESWELMEKKVFGEERYCPPPLVKAGKKIAEKCEGLPLLIITVARLLSKAPKDQRYWEEVAEMKNSVFEDAMDQIYEVLLRSYHFMIQNSKACFLYMGVFPHSYVVRRSRITNLWRAERFAEGFHSVFYYIIYNNLAVVREERFSSIGKAKAFNLHIVYRHLVKREAENNKFLHVLHSYAAEGKYGLIGARLKDNRRLAIYHNTLLAIKEVHKSIDSSLSNLRSVLCTGPYLPYQVPICFELKLLRVLDALNIRFYEFPVEVVRLIQLKYLSLTTNSTLPPSINKLWFLEYLIVHQHSRIIKHTSRVADDESVSYVPVEIWDMKELVHLQIVGRNLPHPPPGATLPVLSHLLDVGVQTCTKEVLEGLPNLEKLRVQIELAPDPNARAEGSSCFDHVFRLVKLDSFRGVVMNPSILPKPNQVLSISSSSVRKLSLSGFGYSWEEMSIIAELPNLEVLKLQSYAFRGDKWGAEEMKFQKLTYLLIEDTDLVQWIAADETFVQLRFLTMKNCHKLKGIPPLKTLYQIVLLDCNPFAQAWANQKVESTGVRVEYSWK